MFDSKAICKHKLSSNETPLWREEGKHALSVQCQILRRWEWWGEGGSDRLLFPLGGRKWCLDGLVISSLGISKTTSLPTHPRPHLQTVKLRLFADQSGTSHLPDCWDMRWVGKCPREPLFKHCCCRDLGILQAASFSVRALVLSCPEGPYPGSGGGGGRRGWSLGFIPAESYKEKAGDLGNPGTGQRHAVSEA